MAKRQGLLMWLAVLGGLASAAPMPSPWPRMTKEARPWTYWWWMGSAVDHANLTRELTRFRDAGLGGVHIIPIYGAKGHEKRYLEFLSPRWMEMLRHTVAEAQRLGLGVDMTLGSGWCFGGPGVAGADACTVARFKDGQVTLETCRQGVKRAGPGGAGPMLNPFSGAAMRRYEERFSEAFQRLPGAKPRAVYHDSFEYQANWTSDLAAEFSKRRGYDLVPNLPKLFGSATDDEVGRLKSDYRETLSDLMAEEFVPAWTDWARKQGMLTRYQAHGSPANLLDLYGASDIPETEMFRGDRSTLISMVASSAAHVMGKRYVSSETGTWMKEHFNERLSDLKELIDQLALAGVNHLFYHGTAYSPGDAPWPGWLFYASTEMNSRNSIWRDVPALNFYVGRLQSMMQSGRPDQDVLLYWPIYDLWGDAKGLNQNLTVHHPAWMHEQPVGSLAKKLMEDGYALDFVSDRQLAQAEVKGGKISMPGGSYAALVIPRVRHMPAATLTKIAALTRSGAKVVFTDGWPEDVPGLGRVELRRQEFRTALSVVKTAAVADLAKAGVRRERMTLPFLRRALDDGHIYFVANRTGRPYVGWLPIGVDVGAAVLMDPMTGRYGVASVKDRREVRVQLRAGESTMIRVYGRAVEGPAWTYWTSAGDPQRLTGEWQITFVQGGPKLPGMVRLAELQSWTKAAGEEGEAFAGTATYKLEFEKPAGSSSTWLLDLGDVRESARVRLNGKYLGTLIMPPYSVHATELKATQNLLEVEVTNLTANRIRDMDRRKVEWRVFQDINFVNWDYKPFDASGWPIQEAGLLGPVSLMPLAPAP